MSWTGVDDPAVRVDHAGIPRGGEVEEWDDELSDAELAAMGFSIGPDKVWEPWCPRPEEIRAAVERGAGGAELVAHLAAAAPPEQRSEAELVDQVDWWGRAAAYCQGMQAAEVGELLARREAVPTDPKRLWASDPWRDTTGQVALALRLSPRSAERVVSDAVMLAEWPATGQALTAGRVDLATARAITEEASLAGAEHRAVLEAAALAQAGEGRTVAQVRAFTRRVALKLDPGAAAERAKAARAERGVTKSVVVDDMGEVRAHLTASEQKEVWDALTVRAKALPAVGPDGQHRCLDERRGDVLVDLVTHPERVRDCAHPDSSGPGSGRWKADVVVAASTLAGEDEDPAELVGHGPVTAPMARQIAADATMRALVVDEDGAVLGRATKRHHPDAANAEHADNTANADNEGGAGTGLAGRVADLTADVAADVATDVVAAAVTGQRVHRSTDRYRPTVAIGDHVEAVHRTCRHPGCRRPSSDCDLDHAKAYAAGGATCICNLVPLCRFHHRLKHLDGWTITLHPDRSVTWTTPTGHRYRAPPSTLWE